MSDKFRGKEDTLGLLLWMLAVGERPIQVEQVNPVNPTDGTDWDTQEPARQDFFFDTFTKEKPPLGKVTTTSDHPYDCLNAEELHGVYGRLRNMLAYRKPVLPGCPLLIDEIEAVLKDQDKHVEDLAKKLSMVEHERNVLSESLAKQSTMNGELERRLLDKKLNLYDFVRETRDTLDSVANLMDEIEREANEL
jgi:hypothetical protein